jgi:hypothetical protein
MKLPPIPHSADRSASEAGSTILIPPPMQDFEASSTREDSEGCQQRRWLPGSPSPRSAVVCVELVTHHQVAMGSKGKSAGKSKGSLAKQPAVSSKKPTGQPCASTSTGFAFDGWARSIASRTRRSSLEAESGSSSLRVACKSSVSVLMAECCHKPLEMPIAESSHACAVERQRALRKSSGQSFSRT